MEKNINQLSEFSLFNRCHLDYLPNFMSLLFMLKLCKYVTKSRGGILKVSHLYCGFHIHDYLPSDVFADRH